MKHFTLHKIVLFLLLLTGYSLTAQSTKKDEIVKKLTDYFFLERENIHVHFDKDVFLTDESVWFKGYTYHRKNNVPFFACVNIFASLIDDEGNILETQLLYGNMGAFSGSFKLKDSMKSGRYYVQFYTNWMNNFAEDESFVSEITVVNKHINPSLFNKPNYSKVNIELHPEGGTLVEGISNSIGISISDCNKKPIANGKAAIVNEKGEEEKTISLNQQGYGKFDFTPNRNKKYKIVTIIEDKEYEQVIPQAELKGVSLEVNNYTMPDKVILKIRINPLMRTSLSGKPLYLVIHKDEKATIAEISYKGDNLEQTVTLNNADLFEGLNTIRILDSELNELAERVIYIYPKSMPNMAIQKSKETDDKIELSGKVGHPNMNLSISMLPENTVTLKEHNDIYNSLLIAPYLENHKTLEAGKYLSAISRKNQYEMDLFLLNQSSKYKWKNIKSNPPKSTYTFDIGLSLKGTINNSGNLKNHKVKVSSFEGMIDETVEINEKNEFFLDNLILADSVKLDFFLVKDDTKKQIKLYPQLFNTNRTYNKQYKPEVFECPQPESNSNAVSDLPELPDQIDTNAIMLDEIEVHGTTNKLKYQRTFGNSQLRGYKITESDSRSFFYVLDLIRYHGFNVEVSNGTVSITGRTVNTINGQPTTPMVYIDNMQVLSFDILWNMQTEDIDEFYINQHAVVPSVNNRMGIIRIYMRKDYSSKAKHNSPTSFLVKNGFQRITPFKNENYLSTATKGFENFGVIDWEPIITTDEKGEFKLELPRTGQENIKLLIEGISPDGKLISEIKTISLN